MRNLLKFLTFGVPLSAFLLACGPVSESQARGSSEVPSGMKEVTITSSGESHPVYYYVPASRAARPAIVLSLHGGGRGAANFVENTKGLLSYADREGFIAVYPDAGGNWNDGRANFVGDPSDVTYLRAVVDWVANNLNGDRNRVYIVGASNGGTMAYKVACDDPGLVRAIAPIIASFNRTQYSNCKPSSPTPVAIFNGTDDPLMVYEGGVSTSRLASFAPQDDVIVPTTETAAFWARVNGCSTTPAAENLPDRVRGDGTTVTVLRYCDRVQLFRVNGGGHTIPGGVERGRIATRLVGNTSQEIDAIGRAVAFFKRFGL